MKIEGEEHEWIDHDECDLEGCRKNKDLITWCDDCEKAFCKTHEDYHNDYNEGRTYCAMCWEVKQHWDKKQSEARR